MALDRIHPGFVVAAAIAGFALGAFAEFQRGKALREREAPPPRSLRSPASAKAWSVKAPTAVSGHGAGESELQQEFDAAQRSRANGHYVLDTDIALLRARAQKRAELTAQQTIDRRRNEYRDLFSSFGIDDSTSSQLVEHIEQIYKAKALLSSTMSSLQNAQHAYDNRIEKLLGDKYQTYLLYEQNYPARVEYDALATLAASTGAVVPAEERNSVEELIRQNNALTFRSFSDIGGPYIAVQEPFSGKDFIPTMRRNIDRLQQQTSLLVAQAKQSHLSDTTIEAISSFYAAEIGRYQGMVQKASGTVPRDTGSVRR